MHMEKDIQVLVYSIQLALYIYTYEKGYSGVVYSIQLQHSIYILTKNKRKEKIHLLYSKNNFKEKVMGEQK